jgi:hypothetical protein
VVLYRSALGNPIKRLYSYSREKYGKELTAWFDEIKSVIPALPANFKRIYSDEEVVSYLHYFSLKIDREFHDSNFAKAAFLTELPSIVVEECLSHLVSEPVLEILRNREKLILYCEKQRKTSERFFFDALPYLNDARSIVLFILELKFFLDPQDRICEWTKNFRYQPSPIDDVVSYSDVRNYSLSLEKVIEYAKSFLPQIADYFGLCHEKDCIDSAILYHQNRVRFKQIVQFTVNHCDSTCPNLVNNIIETIPSKLFYWYRWEWHSISVIEKALPEGGAEHWNRYLHRCGFLRIVFNNRKKCYEALYHLHSNFQSKSDPHLVQDYLHNRTPFQNKRIQTRIFMPSGTDAYNPVSIHLYPDNTGQFDAGGNLQKKLRTIESLLAPKKKNLTVFTCSGQKIDLPPDSTVLNFAYCIHPTNVVFIEEASVNQYPVSVLHSLKTGDIVTLTLGSVPMELPYNWKNVIPAETIPGIEQEIERSFFSAIRKEGRAYIRKRLLENGVEEIPEDLVFDTLLKESIEIIYKTYRLNYAAGMENPNDWWLQQIGVYSAQLKQKCLSLRLELDESIIRTLIFQMIDVIKNTDIKLSYELNIPDGVREKVHTIAYCEVCSPTHHGELIGTVNRTELVLHRAGSHCVVEGGFSVSTRRIDFEPQYFVVETINRIGVGKEILSVFSENQVDLKQFVGARIGLNWGVIRTQVTYIEKKRIETVKRQLEAIPGVQLVLEPGTSPVAMLESPLPPRGFSRAGAWSQPDPFICGNPIEYDANFYGMERELSILNQAYGRTQMPETDMGCSVFIHGPKRIGKTSLLLKFRQEIQEQSYYKAIFIHCETPMDFGWSDLVPLLERDLIQRAVEIGKRLNIPLTVDSRASFIDKIDYLQRILDVSVVLAIDEAIALFYGCIKKNEQADISQFVSLFLSKSRRMIIWVGPQAPVYRLEQKMQKILEKSEPILLEGLNPEETRSLLTAEKLKPKYNIKISDDQVRDIHLLTRGNRFWVNYLGRFMWNQQAERQTGNVEFSKQIFEIAKVELFEYGLPFSDRFKNDMWQQQEVRISQELFFLLGRASDPIHKPVEMAFNELHVSLQERCGDFSSVMLELLLVQLKEMGTLICQGSAKERRWKFFAPILSMYLQFRNFRNL